MLVLLLEHQEIARAEAAVAAEVEVEGLTGLQSLRPKCISDACGCPSGIGGAFVRS